MPMDLWWISLNSEVLKTARLYETLIQGPSARPKSARCCSSSHLMVTSGRELKFGSIPWIRSFQTWFV